MSQGTSCLNGLSTSSRSINSAHICNAIFRISYLSGHCGAQTIRQQLKSFVIQEGIIHSRSSLSTSKKFISSWTSPIGLRLPLSDLHLRKGGCKIHSYDCPNLATRPAKPRQKVPVVAPSTDGMRCRVGWPYYEESLLSTSFFEEGLTIRS